MHVDYLHINLQKQSRRYKENGCPLCGSDARSRGNPTLFSPRLHWRCPTRATFDLSCLSKLLQRHQHINLIVKHGSIRNAIYVGGEDDGTGCTERRCGQPPGLTTLPVARSNAPLSAKDHHPAGRRASLCPNHPRRHQSSCMEIGTYQSVAY